jgi:hypothetical protein
MIRSFEGTDLGDRARAISHRNCLRCRGSVGLWKSAKTRTKLRDATNLGALGKGRIRWTHGRERIDCCRRRGPVGLVPVTAPSLSSSDEAEGREKRLECLHLDAK